MSFNSTMVRLKELLKAKTVGGRMRFNSTMVRLKACT